MYSDMGKMLTRDQSISGAWTSASSMSLWDWAAVKTTRALPWDWIAQRIVAAPSAAAATARHSEVG